MFKHSERWSLTNGHFQHHKPEREEKWSLGDIEQRRQSHSKKQTCYNDRVGERARREMMDYVGDLN